MNMVNIRFLLPGGDDGSETPSAKKHPLPVAKGTLSTSTIINQLNTIKGVNAPQFRAPCVRLCFIGLI